MKSDMYLCIYVHMYQVLYTILYSALYPLPTYSCDTQKSIYNSVMVFLINFLDVLYICRLLCLWCMFGFMKYDQVFDDFGCKIPEDEEKEIKKIGEYILFSTFFSMGGNIKSIAGMHLLLFPFSHLALLRARQLSPVRVDTTHNSTQVTHPPPPPTTTWTAPPPAIPHQGLRDNR